MPVAILERDEFSSSKACNGFAAPAALFGKKVTIASSTKWLLVTRSELLLGQLLVTVGTGKAFLVPRLVLVGHTPFVDHPTAFATLLCKLILVTGNTHNFLVTWDETLVPDWLHAHHAAETLLMPLLTAVLKLLHASLEWFFTSIAACSKFVIMTIRAKNILIFRSKWLVYQGFLTLKTLKTKLVPVTILVGQVLVVGTNRFLALLTIVSELLLVAGDTVGVLLFEDVATSNQLLITVMASQMVFVVVLLHGFRIFPRKYQLITGRAPRANKFSIVTLAVELFTV